MDRDGLLAMLHVLRTERLVPLPRFVTGKVETDFGMVIAGVVEAI